MHLWDRFSAGRPVQSSPIQQGPLGHPRMAAQGRNNLCPGRVNFIAGAAVQWLRDELKIIDSAAEIESLAEQVEDSGGVTFVPALAGTSLAS